jgi:arylsulfatase A-like enzyme
MNGGNIMLRRFITDNKCVIGIFSIFIFFVISCSDKQDSAKENKAEKSVETTVIDFGNELHREHLLEGWHADEKVKDRTTFVWSSGKVSKLEIVVFELSDKQVLLKCLPFEYPKASGQTIKVSINDKFLTTIELDKNWKDWKEYKFLIPASDLKKGQNILTFDYGYVKSPSEAFQGNTDARPLAVAFDYIKIAPLVGTTITNFGSELHKKDLLDKLSKTTRRPMSIIPQFVTIDYKCPHCNVVLIMIDTLRADHLGIYGYERDTSPNIDAFAEKSLLFENVRSQAACTFPSVNSILTSQFPSNFLGQSNGRIGIPEHIKSLAEIFKNKNYSTIAISASPIVRKTPSNNNKFGGFDRGFDFFNEECELKDASCINDKVFKLLNSTKSPFFLYLHYMDPHDPYSPPKEFTKQFSENYNDKEFIKEGNPDPIEKMLYGIGSNVNLTKEDIKHLIDLYDDEIAYFDSQFKILLDKISEKDLMDKTIIIITADHGEEFMEHNSIKHCHTLFDTESKIPLIIRIPSMNKKVTGKAAALDIIPTILDYLDFSLSDYSFDGKSLRPVIESNRDINKNVFSAQFTLRSINDDRYKLIYDISLKNFLLYDLTEDKDETKNIMGTKTNVFEELKGKLFEWLYMTEGENLTKSVENAEEIKKQLKALGYIE